MKQWLCLLQHLDTPGNYARLLFIDFCSAFNSIQRHRVIKKLQGLEVSSPLIHWIYNFLSIKAASGKSGSFIITHHWS